MLLWRVRSFTRMIVTENEGIVARIIDSEEARMQRRALGKAPFYGHSQIRKKYLRKYAKAEKNEIVSDGNPKVGSRRPALDKLLTK